MTNARDKDPRISWPRTKKTFRLMYADIFTKTNFDNETIRNNLIALRNEISRRGTASETAVADASEATTLPWRDLAHLSMEEKRAALDLVQAARGSPESHDLMIAFLNGLLAIQREADEAPSRSKGNATSTTGPATASTTAGELERLHRTLATRPAEQVTIDPMRYGTAIPNAGGGDCVIHALEGRNLTDEELLVTRAELADIRRTMPDTETSPSANASLLATLLLETPRFSQNGLSLMQGRHAIPNRVLADFQAIPGGYAGVETIEQWVALPRNHDKTVVSIELEQRKGDLFRGGKRIEPSLSVNSKEDLKKLDDMVREANVVLYLERSHWEQIEKSEEWKTAGDANVAGGNGEGPVNEGVEDESIWASNEFKGAPDPNPPEIPTFSFSFAESAPSTPKSQTATLREASSAPTAAEAFEMERQAAWSEVSEKTIVNKQQTSLAKSLIRNSSEISSWFGDTRPTDLRKVSTVILPASRRFENYYGENIWILANNLRDYYFPLHLNEIVAFQAEKAGVTAKDLRYLVLLHVAAFDARRHLSAQQFNADIAELNGTALEVFLSSSLGKASGRIIGDCGKQVENAKVILEDKEEDVYSVILSLKDNADSAHDMT